MNKPFSPESILAYIDSSPRCPTPEIDTMQYVLWWRRQNPKPRLEVGDKGRVLGSTPNLQVALSHGGLCGYYLREVDGELQMAPYGTHAWVPLVWADLKQGLLDRIGMRAPQSRIKAVTRWAVAQPSTSRN